MPDQIHLASQQLMAEQAIPHYLADNKAAKVF
jgi:hypothetical protein